MATCTSTELAFIDHADKVAALLRDAWYGIEDHMTAGGGLVLLDDGKRDFLRDAAHQVHIRTRNLLDDDQRLQLREVTAAAVVVVLRGHEPSSWDEAYRDQEKIHTATTLLLDTCSRLTASPGRQNGSPKGGRPVKYDNKTLQLMTLAFDDAMEESNDARAAYEKVADLYGVGSGEAARKAIERYKSGQK